MRLDLANRLDKDSDLYDTQFMRCELHKLYVLVEGITREVNLVKFTQSTQKMRLEQANTLEQEFDMPFRECSPVPDASIEWTVRTPPCLLYELCTPIHRKHCGGLIS